MDVLAVPCSVYPSVAAWDYQQPHRLEMRWFSSCYLGKEGAMAPVGLRCITLPCCSEVAGEATVTEVICIKTKQFLHIEDYKSQRHS